MTVIFSTQLAAIRPVSSMLRLPRSHREAIARAKAREVAHRRTIVIRSSFDLMKASERGDPPFKDMAGAVVHSMVHQHLMDPIWGEVRMTKFSISGLRSFDLRSGHTIISNEVTGR